LAKTVSYFEELLRSVPADERLVRIPAKAS
jgi:hypothetical protein